MWSGEQVHTVHSTRPTQVLGLLALLVSANSAASISSLKNTIDTWVRTLLALLVQKYKYWRIRRSAAGKHAERPNRALIAHSTI